MNHPTAEHCVIRVVSALAKHWTEDPGAASPEHLRAFLELARVASREELPVEALMKHFKKIDGFNALVADRLSIAWYGAESEPWKSTES